MLDANHHGLGSRAPIRAREKEGARGSGGTLKQQRKRKSRRKLAVRRVVAAAGGAARSHRTRTAREHCARVRRTGVKMRSLSERLMAPSCDHPERNVTHCSWPYSNDAYRTRASISPSRRLWDSHAAQSQSIPRAYITLWANLLAESGRMGYTLTRTVSRYRTPPCLKWKLQPSVFKQLLLLLLLLLFLLPHTFNTALDSLSSITQPGRPL